MSDEESATLGTARLAGVLYLTVIAGGLFAETLVRAPLITAGDAVATSHAIAPNLPLWR